MSRARKVAGGVGRGVRFLIGLVLVVALVGGVPYLLVRFVGNPVPEGLPAWDEVVLAAQSRQLNDGVAVQGLALLVWLGWAHLMVSLSVEIWAAARGFASSTVRGLGATQWLARRVVAQLALTSTLVVQSASTLTAPTLPTAPAVLPPVASVAHDAGETNAEVSGIVADNAAWVGQGPEVLVTSGDTLWDLAEEYLGSGERWTEIREANSGRRMPDGTVLGEGFLAIEGGWSLVIPTGQSDGVTEPGVDIASTVGAGVIVEAESPVVIGAWRVEQGDHFWSMAETVLAQSWGRTPTEGEIREYWLDIISVNRDHLISPGNDPNEIYVDQQFDVVLPSLPAEQPRAADSTTSPTSPTSPTSLTSLSLEELEEIPQFIAAPSSTDATVEVGLSSGAVGGSTTEDPLVSRAPTPAVAADPQVVVDSNMPSDSEPGERETVFGLPAMDPAEALREGGVVFTGLAAAGLMASLRLRRRAQAVQRRPGSVPSLPDPPLAEYERLVRSIADHERLRWLTATNKFMSEAVDGATDSEMPAIVAVLAGDHGVEVLLDEPVEPPRGFIAGDSPKTWVLDPGLEVRQVEHEGADRLPFAPLLLPVGDTQAGELLVDLGQLSVVNVEGTEAAILGWMRALAVAVDSSAWSDQVRVIAIGVDPVLSRLDDVHIPEDPIAWAAAEVDRRKATGLMEESGYERRLDGVDIEEMLVLVGPGHEEVAQHLVSVAELANTPLTLVAAAPIVSEARLHFDGGACKLEPAGLRFRPAAMSEVAVAMTTTLLDGAAETTMTWSRADQQLSNSASQPKR